MSELFEIAKRSNENYNKKLFTHNINNKSPKIKSNAYKIGTILLLTIILMENVKGKLICLRNTLMKTSLNSPKLQGIMQDMVVSLLNVKRIEIQFHTKILLKG